MGVLTNILRQSSVPLPPESITQAAEFRAERLDAGSGLPPYCGTGKFSPTRLARTTGAHVLVLPSRKRHKDSLPAKAACSWEHQGDTRERASHSHGLMLKDTYPYWKFRPSGHRCSLLVPCLLRSSHINGIRFGDVRGSPPFRLPPVIEKEYFHLQFYQSPSTAHQ